MFDNILTKSQKNPNLNFIGDPFVDAGLIALSQITGLDPDQCSEKELKKAAERLVSLYLTPAWSKELYSIFPNSTFLQPGKNYDREGESKKFLCELIDDTGGENGKVCCFCGRPAYDRKQFLKTQIPLTGTSKFTNFFPSFQNGLSVCSRCALAVQFAPLTYYKAGGKPCLVSSDNPAILRHFAREALAYQREGLATGRFDAKENSGIYDEKFRSPENALFHLAYKFGKEYYQNGICGSNETIIIYHIDNYNQNPTGVFIYRLPASIFSFVAMMMNSPEYRSAWFSLLSKHYVKSSKSDDDLPVWKTSFNWIHNSLLNHKSILWAFKDNSTRTLTVPWPVVEEYMMRVRNMNKQRIIQIRDLADSIALCIRESKNKKRVNDIVSARDLPAFRNQLRLVFRDWQKIGKDEPLATFDEYVGVIIPGDYRGWTEVRDLIAIRLYEQLHDMLAEEEVQTEGDKK